MLYAILAHHAEAEVNSWSAEEDTVVMANLRKAHDRLNQVGRLGPAARLGETKKARTLRGAGDGMMIRRAVCRDQGAIARLLCRGLSG